MFIKSILFLTAAITLAAIADAESRDELYEICVPVTQSDGQDLSSAETFCTCLSDGAEEAGQSIIDELFASGSEPDLEKRIQSLSDEAKDVVEACQA